MGKGIKRQAKQEKDFKKQRFKVGKTLKKAKNETSVNVKVAKLALPEAYGSSEAVEGGKAGQATLPEVIKQLGHHNGNVRRAALQSLSSLLQREGAEFTRAHLSQVLAATISCLSDDDKSVRASFIALFEEVLQAQVSEDDVQPFLAMMMAYVRSAASHLHLGCRQDAVVFLQALVGHCASIVSEQHMPAVLNMFDGLLSQKHRETSLKAQSAASVAASVAALHSILSTTCLNVDEESSELPASGCFERPARAWKANKAVKLLIQLPGILQQAANGVDVLKGKRNVQEITESASPQDIVDVSDSLIQRLFFCWDTCLPVDDSTAPAETQATSTCLVHTLECMSMLLAQLPCSHTGSDRRRELIFNKVRVLAHEKLLNIFPVLPDTPLAAKLPHALANKLNQRVSQLLMKLDPWLCVPQAGKAVRQEAGRQRKSPPQLCTGSSKDWDAAVSNLIQCVGLLQEQPQTPQMRGAACRRSFMYKDFNGESMPLSVQRLLDYAMFTMGSTGGSIMEQGFHQVAEVT